MTITNFIRIEKKYLTSDVRASEFIRMISERLTSDPHGRSTVCNAYLDTPDYRIIRTSIDAEDYKEKLRIRSYGVPSDSDTVFLELKKKYRGIVYKRREPMLLSEALSFVEHGIRPFESQIISELDSAMVRNGKPVPAAMVYYDRDAYYDVTDPTLRITFDRNIRTLFGKTGFDDPRKMRTLLPADCVLIEIKTGGGMPMWLSSALNNLEIYPTSFSKYGSAFLRESAEGNLQIIKERFENA